MPVTITGTKELKARMNSVREVFKPAGSAWAKETLVLAQRNFAPHNHTNKVRFRVLASKKRAAVVASWPARVVEGDTKAHLITAKPGKALRFQSGGRTIFARKAQRRARVGTPFLKPAGIAALAANPIGDEVAKAWNSAA